MFGPGTPSQQVGSTVAVEDDGSPGRRFRLQGHSEAMVRVGVVTRVSLADVVGHLKTIDDRLREATNGLFEVRLDQVQGCGPASLGDSDTT